MTPLFLPPGCTAQFPGNCSPAACPAALMAGKRVSVCTGRVIPLCTETAQSSLTADPSVLIEQMAPAGRT